MNLSIINAVSLGDAIDLHYISKDNKDYMLSTSIYDIISETEIYIHNPLKDGKLFLIPMGLKITVITKRADYGVLAFDIYLEKRIKMGNVYAIQCKVVSDIKKQQRRHFYRVKLYRDVNIRYLTDYDDNALKYYVFDPDTIDCNEIEVKVSTLDISGGGIGFRSKTEYELGTYIYFKLDFFDLKTEIYGKVMRCFKSSKYDNEYEIGIAFEELPNEFVRKITSYVFSSQQKARRKE